MKFISATRNAEIYERSPGRLLKLFPAHLPPTRAHQELANAQAAYQAGIPSPEPLECIEQEGRLGIVFEKLQGQPLSQFIASQPHNIKAHGAALARLHHQLHQHQVPQLPTQLDHLKPRLKASFIPLKPYWPQLQNWQNTLIGQAQFLCHGDLSPDNILVTSKGWMIIDWADAHRGNPLGDVARTVLLLNTPHTIQQLPRWKRTAFRWGSSRLSRAYQKSYLQQAGVEPAQLKPWLGLLAAARLCEEIPHEKDWLMTTLQNCL